MKYREERLEQQRLPTTTNRLFIGEIFQSVIGMENDNMKATFLRQYDSPALRSILIDLFSTRFKWLGKVPSYRPSDAPMGLAETNLYADWKRTYLFREPESTKLGPAKTNQLLTMMLESLHSIEAEVLEAIVSKDRNEPFKGVSREIAKLAFPNIREQLD